MHTLNVVTMTESETRFSINTKDCTFLQTSGYSSCSYDLYKSDLGNCTEVAVFDIWRQLRKELLSHNHSSSSLVIAPGTVVVKSKLFALVLTTLHLNIITGANTFKEAFITLSTFTANFTYREGEDELQRFPEKRGSSG